MILWLHRLREDEEGQTLVLGAVFGVVLALCVLGTVNLGRAVYEKIQVQSACDSGAYSQAAVEARVLNLTAYTNRAMVVHYASIMAMSAYVTWLHFTDVWVQELFKIFQNIPYIGVVFSIINEVIAVLLDILDAAVMIGTPLVSAANIVLYGLQEGAWNSLYLQRLAKTPPEAHSGDSIGDPNGQYQPVWPNLVNFANQTVFAQTRGNVTILPSTLQSLEILINSSNPQVQEARLHMVEIANSARPPWVAYGDNYGQNVWSPFARHWTWGLPFLCNAELGTTARTQMGVFAPGLSIQGLLNTTGEIYSGSRGQASIHCHVPIFGNFSVIARLFDLTTLDQFLGFTSLTPQSTWQGYKLFTSGLLGDAIGLLVNATPLPALGNAAAAFGQSNVKLLAPDYRAMWISPYVFFAPSTKAGPAGGVAAIGPGLGNFGQPDVIFALARGRTDFNKAPAQNANAFLNQHPVGGIIAGQGGQIDFSYNGNDWPGVAGLPPGLQLQPGFNAVCAAQTYYHRPGDWKEMPNFFNPLWAARLMPVVESNAAASLGLNNTTVGNLILH